MPSRIDKYRYGLIVNQAKYPVIVHKPSDIQGRPACGRGDEGIHIQTRLLDGNATVYCADCWDD